MIIAIDGPAGSGKSTIAKLIANELNMTYLDTGAMYRLFTLKLLKENVDVNNKKQILYFLENLNIDIKNNKFYLDEIDETNNIRSNEVSNNVSFVAAIKEVREKMVDLQRKFSESKDVILDGRDIGTVVFPHAEIKIFLIADANERARRRLKELEERGEKISYEEIYNNIIERDKMDSTREESPLKKAEDAIVVDTTGKGIEKVKNEILLIYHNKKG